MTAMHGGYYHVVAKNVWLEPVGTIVHDSRDSEYTVERGLIVQHNKRVSGGRLELV